MKKVVLAALLTCGAVSFPVAASADHLAWQLIGTNPDVYAPNFPQPSPRDYFQRIDGADRSFLHPRIGVSFAALRAEELCRSLRANSEQRSLAASTRLSCPG